MTDYTNRELDNQFTMLKQVILDAIHHQNEKLDRIEEQVTKTNGRVTKLEFWREGLTAKVAAIVGSVGVGWVLIKEFIIK